ncbi:MAG TPA: aminotransferase class I/II-fold pyridoxal phosphate-dependent enzyme [Patescibacteria group bacterium]|nr:aminotransferase class I/II-fold pyridoxal phosphate-dependent enzyme [Patescibacteria group bacterium]
MTLQQTRIPLLSAMRRYAAAGVTPFYTPGHKMGKGMDPALADILGSAALALDMGLPYEMDDLHEPQGPIKEAQQLAAELYGADQSFFTINGTTCGIQAMMMAMVGPGEKILLPRNAHRSVVSGLIFSGATPVFLVPEVDSDLGIALGVTPATVEEALRRHPDARGVLLVNPTYYGVATDLAGIVDLVHRHQLPVAVDEAHGPHLHFADGLPMTALAAGADVTAQSTHKILGALTQCSMVHWREGYIPIERLKVMLRLVQSTSPNYLLLASLDVARMQMAIQGRELVGKAVEWSHWLRREINAVPGLYCFGDEKIAVPGIYSLDPTKVTVRVTGLGLTGPQAEEILRHRYKIQAELSDVNNVLFLITLGDREEDVQRLAAALKSLAESCRDQPPLLRAEAEAIPYPELVLTPREAVFAANIRMSFDMAIGRVCAETITFYPPGIPVVCPGERITRDIVAYCRRLRAAGLHVSGVEDLSLNTVKVVG